MVVQRSPFDGDGSELAHAQTGLQMLVWQNFQEQEQEQEQESGTGMVLLCISVTVWRPDETWMKNR